MIPGLGATLLGKSGLTGGSNPFAGGFYVPSVYFRANTKMFFDKKAVIDAMDKMIWKSLSIASLKVKTRAVKSIRKMGRAKPPLRVQRENPGLNLRGMARAANGTFDRRTHNSLRRRLMEVQTKPPSAPGTPPHTHVPNAHMLGFRRNLYNFFDARTKSAVVGPMPRGRPLPYLHEFGGRLRLETFVWQNRWSGNQMYYRRIVPGSEAPGSRWQPTGTVSTVRYPARPFMKPALKAAIAAGELNRPFGGRFGVSYGG